MSSSRKTGQGQRFVIAAAFALTVAAAATASGFSSARAEDMGASASSAEQADAEIGRTLGGVPSFIRLYPKVSVAAAWAQVRDLEFSDKTALPPKMKALIGLAVAAQIPCQYCVWSDTKTARENGATDQEIAEAVALAGLERHWSTFFNGMQIDFATFKKEMSGDAQAAK
jgi:AhpD family alkylhydroperoxidase